MAMHQLDELQDTSVGDPVPGSGSIVQVAPSHHRAIGRLAPPNLVSLPTATHFAADRHDASVVVSDGSAVAVTRDQADAFQA